ncbi:MAG: GTPase [Ruminococcus sp.]|nr:GTPase [Ruminococcus sp.]
MPSREREMIPVYLFLGFLESGKTKFIQETLEDKRFNTGERTLLLICEEGEEEYDPSRFPKKDVYMRVIEDKNQLTEENLSRLLHECRAERVVIEYNGMWTVSDLFSNMPDDWGIYQVMFFADASTFMQYNANMRSLVVDKLNICELTVFNRFDKSMDMMEFHKIVRGVSRRSDIAYEYTDGEVKYDEIEDPLLFDVEAKEITIEDNDYALWYRDIMDKPMKYDGKIISFRAIAARNPKFPKDTVAVGRHIMTCCVEDIQYCWVAAQLDGKFEVGNRKWIQVKGLIKVQKHKLYRGKGPVLYVSEIKETTAPEKEVATFY